MASFAVRIEIDTRLSLRGLLHLDGLLGAVATARGRGPGDIPLDRFDGVWSGSAAILEIGAFGAAQTKEVRIKHLVDDRIPGEIFAQLKPSERKVGEMSPMRGRLSGYECFDGVRAVWFTGNGDLDAVLDLLGDVRNLGAMGRTGYGRVRQIEPVAVHESALAGFAFAGNFPARVIPLDVWRRHAPDAGGSAIIALQRAVPPYWCGPEEPCISPAQTDLLGTRTEIMFRVRAT